MSKHIAGLPGISVESEGLTQEDRVHHLDSLAASGTMAKVPECAWLGTVGMFSGDDDMVEISEEILKIRDSDRRD